MFCTKCGKAISDNSTFCPYCGTHLISYPTIETQGKNPLLLVLKAVVIGFGSLILLGVIAAIIVPSFSAATQRSKQKRTMADMKSIANAIESYRSDNGALPLSGEQNLKCLVPKYIRKLPSRDSWENPFYYISDIAREHYSLGSGARDESIPNWNMLPDTTTSFDDDIILFDGKFTVYPEGIRT
jgi:type II secretory pathway pseudopilin PulG